MTTKTTNKAGPRTRLTRELIDQIVEILADGNYVTDACQAVGIGESTYYKWTAEGREAERTPPSKRTTRQKLCMEFVDATTKATARGTTELLAKIRELGHGGQVVETRTITKPDGTVEIIEKRQRPHWQALAWILERRHPDRFARRVKMTVDRDSLASYAEQLERELLDAGIDPDTGEVIE